MTQTNSEIRVIDAARRLRLDFRGSRISEIRRKLQVQVQTPCQALYRKVDLDPGITVELAERRDRPWGFAAGVRDCVLAFNIGSA